MFYSHLHNRGYPSKAIRVDSTFRTMNWNQRSKMLEPKKLFFARYRGCVFSNRNAPGSAELRVEMDLSLEELLEAWNKAGGATSSPHAPSLRSGARSLWVHNASVKYLRSQWGYLGGPKIVSIPDPCSDPSAAELISRTLGPVQTSLREFESIHIIGG